MMIMIGSVGGDGDVQSDHAIVDVVGVAATSITIVTRK